MHPRSPLLQPVCSSALLQPVCSAALLQPVCSAALPQPVCSAALPQPVFFCHVCVLDFKKLLFSFLPCTLFLFTCFLGFLLVSIISFILTCFASCPALCFVFNCCVLGFTVFPCVSCTSCSHVVFHSVPIYIYIYIYSTLFCFPLCTVLCFVCVLRFVLYVSCALSCLPRRASSCSVDLFILFCSCVLLLCCYVWGFLRC